MSAASGSGRGHARTQKSGPQNRGAFTLVEVLVVVAVIAIIASMLLPTLAKGRQSAQRIQCVNNLRQLGFAAHLYWDDNGGENFRYYHGTSTNGVVYWFGWLGNGAEGERPFDPGQGALYSYVRGRGVEMCPSLNYDLGEFKLKATGAAYGYGVNENIAPRFAFQPTVKISRIRRPSELSLLADAAQVNTFLPPASPSNPMLEEFFYLDIQTNFTSAAYRPNGHFRHRQKANVLFVDGHVSLEKPVAGSIDKRLPQHHVGQLRPEILRMP